MRHKENRIIRIRGDNNKDEANETTKERRWKRMDNEMHDDDDRGDNRE